ncbi:MAG: hypothetical protein ABIT76_10140 [Chthoniobacterales bacterium]
MMPLSSALALLVGVGVLGLAFRTVAHPIAQKLAVLCLFGVSFLIGWLPGGSVWMGFVCLSIWLLLPWLEILTRVRRLRLPMDKTLESKRPPSRELFPDLDELTEEIESNHFAHVEDTGWDWENQAQFFRLFYREKEKMQAAICSIDQDQVAFFYLSLSTRTTDGKLWTTWNYPFSTALKPSPNLQLNRVAPMSDFVTMISQHESFLAKNHVNAESTMELNAETMLEGMQTDLRQQIDHNLRAGVLLPSEEGKVRYSWRGLFFIWCQFIWDFVRL